MARFTIIAIFLAALMCLSGISASRGGARDLQASSKCVVYTSAKAVAANQIVCESAYEDACAEHVKYFCRNPYAPVPDKVQAVAKARARAVAKAVAEASVSISMDGWISAACLPGSYSAFEASARAKAMAQAVATSYVKAVAKVYGLNEFDSVYAKVTDSSKALARACETKYISICGPYHKCEKTECTESRCGLACHYYDDAATTATAKAVAVAIARAEALVETYYNSEECKDDCKIRLCNYTCPEGCTPPTA